MPIAPGSIPENSVEVHVAWSIFGGTNGNVTSPQFSVGLLGELTFQLLKVVDAAGMGGGETYTFHVDRALWQAAVADGKLDLGLRVFGDEPYLNSASLSVSYEYPTREYSLVANTVDFTVFDQSYGRGGSAGNLTIEIKGAKFDRTVTARLTDGGTVNREAASMFHVDATRTFATFDLTGLTAGTYDVIVEKADGATASVIDSLEVVAGGGANILSELDAPGAVRPEQSFSFLVGWGNSGLNDGLAPLIVVGSDVPFGPNPGDYSLGTSTQFLGTATDGPPGIIRPGQGYTVRYFAPSVPAGGATTFVDRLGTNSQLPFDWNSLRDDLIPEGMSDDEFQPIFEQLVSQVGPTWGDYLTMLARNSTLLPIELGNNREPLDLLHIELVRARAAIGTSISGIIDSSGSSFQLGGRTVRADNSTTGDSFFAITLNDGEFVFDGISSGSYDFDVPGLILRSTQPANVNVNVGDILSGFVLNVEAGVSLGGHIESVTNRAPVSGASIRIVEIETGATSFTTSGENGTYRFDGLRPVEYSIIVDADRFARYLLEGISVSSDMLLVPLRLHPESLIAGSVSFGGPGEAEFPLTVLAIQNASNSISGTFVAQVEESDFQFNGLPPGTFDIVLRRPGYSTRTITGVVIGDQESRNLGNILLEQSATVRGNVTALGESLSPAHKSIGIFNDDTLITSVQSDAAGAFEISELALGTYVLRILNLDDGFSDDVSVTVDAGDALNGVSLKIVPGKLLVGKVLNAKNNAPLRNIDVRLFADGVLTLVTTTDSLGHYEFANLARGQYLVSVDSGSALSAHAIVIDDDSAPSTVIDLSVDIAATIGGRLTTSEGDPIADGIVLLFKADIAIATATTDLEGKYEFLMSQIGDFRLQAGGTATFADVADVSVMSGDSIQQDFVAGSGSITLSIIGAIGDAASFVARVFHRTSGAWLLVDQSPFTSDSLSFGNLAPGIYAYEIVGAGNMGALGSVNVENGISTRVDAEFMQLTELTGVVTNTMGTPIARAQIVLAPNDGETLPRIALVDDHGRFRITHLPTGQYVASVLATESATAAQHIQVGPGSTIMNFVLETGSHFIVGVVESPDGNAVPGAQIELIDDDGHVIAWGEADSEGLFKLPSIDATDAIVRISSPGYLSRSINIPLLSQDADENLGHLSLLNVAIATHPNVDTESLQMLRGVASLYFSDLLAPFRIPHELTSVKPLPDHCEVCRASKNTAVKGLEAQQRAFTEAERTQTKLRDAVADFDSEFTKDVGRFSLEVASFIPIARAFRYGGRGFRILSSISPKLAKTVEFVAISTLSNYLSARDGIREAQRNTNFEAVLPAMRAAIAITGQGIDFSDFVYTLAVNSARGGVDYLGRVSGVLSIVGKLLDISGTVDNLIFAKSIEKYTRVTETKIIFLAAKRTYERSVHTALSLNRTYETCLRACMNKEMEQCEGDCDDMQHTQQIVSMDPNDILGPEGFGGSRWVTATDNLQYTIRFENDPVLATAPAQKVRITQQLDDDLDYRTFRVGDFAIGTTFVVVPDNQAFFAGRIDLTAESGVVVEVTAGIDVAMGEAFWEFTAIDPATGETPQDALKGLLPPNLTSPEGEGFVSYSVRAKSSAQTGDVIDALATIVFDINEPIDTPSIFNTIDAGIPASSVASLPQSISGTTFAVNWSGADEEQGSGLAGYDIYVSENGGPYKIFLANTTLTSAQFVGGYGRHYSFYSLARDNAGNVESPPSVADATILIERPITVIVGRHIFYNNSSFDSNSPSPTAADDAAIATDKQALLPGRAATFANYTSYSRGVNGIMVDISRGSGPLTASDFRFRIGNSNDLATWANAPAPVSITVRDGEGTAGSDRVTILWNDNAIKSEWLEVTVLAAANTGLAAPDVFYFGNASGESGNEIGNAVVTIADALAARGHISTVIGTPIDSHWDYNRDGFVTAADVQVAQQNLTAGDAVLNLISPSAQIHSTAITLIRGDINLDGRVDAADLSALMKALTDMQGYASQRGLSAAGLTFIGDVNQSGSFNNADLQALINLLLGGAGQSESQTESISTNSQTAQPPAAASSELANASTAAEESTGNAEPVTSMPEFAPTVDVLPSAPSRSDFAISVIQSTTEQLIALPLPNDQPDLITLPYVNAQAAHRTVSTPLQSSMVSSWKPTGSQAALKDQVFGDSLLAGLLRSEESAFCSEDRSVAQMVALGDEAAKTFDPMDWTIPLDANSSLLDLLPSILNCTVSYRKNERRPRNHSIAANEDLTSGMWRE